MNTQVQLSTPATADQISEALKVLFRSMRLPPGSDPDKAVIGYMTALVGLPIEAINRGIQRFLRGECNDVSPKFCPYPPELAKICRTTRYISVVPAPEPRGYVPANQEMPGARDRMRLKMPMYAFAQRHGLTNELDEANRAGFGAMVVLATNWGIEIPQELLERPDAEEEWRCARNRVWAEIERNPPPFMRKKKSA